MIIYVLLESLSKYYTLITPVCFINDNVNKELLQSLAILLDHITRNLYFLHKHCITYSSNIELSQCLNNKGRKTNNKCDLSSDCDSGSRPSKKKNDPKTPTQGDPANRSFFMLFAI